MGPVMAVLATADVANSLYNIKTMVYENHELTMTNSDRHRRQFRG
jgi:hypothetical protein